MEPLTILAGAVTKYILPKALEKIGETIGESSFAKSTESIKAIQSTVANKLETAGMTGVLSRAKEKPTSSNIQVLETILEGQLSEDNDFAQQLQQLLNQIEKQSPGLQAVLDSVRVKGNVEVGDITQSTDSQSAEYNSQQVIGRNLGVGGDLKIGNVTQTKHS